MRRIALVLLLALFASPALAETKRERAQKLMKTLLDDKDAADRADAARELGSMGATDSVDTLVKALSDRDKGVRLAASSSLWKLGEAARPAVPAMTKAFEGASGWFKLNLGGALEDLGTDREELVEGYRRVLESNDASARVEAASRLRGHVPDSELIPVVNEALDDDSVRSEAQAVLRKLQPKSGEETSSVVRRLHHKDSSVRGDALRQLARTKPLPKDALPEMLGLIEDSEESVRRTACSAMGTLGASHAAQTVPLLVRALRTDEATDVRKAAGQALGEIGPAAKEAIPALVEALQKDKEREVREAACEGLQGMGKTAKAAIPALEAAQKDADGFVRNAAWRALLRVDPKS